jgi:hypothetical protein
MIHCRSGALAQARTEGATLIWPCCHTRTGGGANVGVQSVEGRRTYDGGST